MAFATDQNQDPNGPNGPNAQGQSPANQPPANPTTGSSVGSAGGTKSPNQPSNSVAPAPFTNLQSYLNVNAPQIQNTANQVAGQLGNQYGQVTGDIDKAGKDFSAQVNSGYAAPDQNLVKSAAANPTDFAKDPNNVKAFQAQLNDSYQGPANFETTSGYGNVQGEAQNAVDQAQNLGTYSGLQSYLTSNVEKNPTQAMSAMDTALLNQSPDAISTVQNAAKPLGTLTNYLQDTTTQKNTLVPQAQAAAGQAAKFAKDTFTGDGGVVPAWQKAITDKVAQQQAAADKYNASVNKVTNQVGGLQSILANAQDAIKGYNDQTYNPTGNVAASKLAPITADLSGLSKVPEAITGAATPESVASANDFSKQSALNQLLGSNLTNLNPTLANQAGTFNVPGQEASLPIAQAIQQLTDQMTAARNAYTDNGKLQYAGAPQDSIITNNDLPPGYTLVPASAFESNNHGAVVNNAPKGSIEVGQGDRFGNNFIAVPPGTSLPKGVQSFGTVSDKGGRFVPNTAGTTPSIGDAVYTTNQPLQNANKNITDLLTYLKGLS